MVISQGDVWWADLPEPSGSGPGLRASQHARRRACRKKENEDVFLWPIVVVQGDALNRSRVGTVVCVPLTSNLKWAGAPGNVRLSSRATGLPKESVANVSQVIALDKALLTERTAKLPRAKLELVLSGIDVVLGR